MLGIFLVSLRDVRTGEEQAQSSSQRFHVSALLSIFFGPLHDDFFASMTARSLFLATFSENEHTEKEDDYMFSWCLRSMYRTIAWRRSDGTAANANLLFRQFCSRAVLDVLVGHLVFTDSKCMCPPGYP